MPSLPCRRERSAVVNSVMSSPSMKTWPASGRISPTAIFRVTDLPWPDAPMITSERPGWMAMSTPSSTLRPSKVLVTALSCSFGEAEERGPLIAAGSS